MVLSINQYFHVMGTPISGPHLLTIPKILLIFIFNPSLLKIYKTKIHVPLSTTTVVEDENVVSFYFIIVWDK